MKFLFIGDSITDGGRGLNGDPNHILGHGFVFNIAAELGSRYASLRPKFYNRGVSGESSWHIRERWQSDALDIAPDVLTLLCGVNDMLICSGSDPVREHCSQRAFADNLAYMLESARQSIPAVRLILGVPFFYEVSDIDERFDTPGDRLERKTALRYRKVFGRAAESKISDMALRQQTVRRLAAEYGALLLDIPELFEEAFKSAPRSYWIWDGVHPTCAMHGCIAARWLELFGPLQ